MSVYVNRTLNMKKIKAIGFDMDYTLVRYNTEAFEELAFYSMINKLVAELHYPEGIKEIKYDFKKMIQGLVIDKNKGTVLKLSRHGKVKTGYFGTKRLDFKKQQEMYGGQEVDLSDKNIVSLDTNFSLAKGTLYAELVEFFKTTPGGPGFAQLEVELQSMLDLCHRDGTLKDEVAKNIEKFIVQDPELPPLLEKYKKYGKKLIIITNSDYKYTKLLMEHTFDPFLKEHDSWLDLFETTITFSCKPRFFTDKNYFLRIDTDNGTMTNVDEKIEHGVFQGGNAAKLQKDLEIDPEEILYLGDHIYGDVVAIKKTFNWRTAMVFEPLIEELENIEKNRPIQEEINTDMAHKLQVEKKLNDLYAAGIEHGEGLDAMLKDDVYQEIEDVNKKISTNIEKYQDSFNPYWGEMMRSGYEESRLAGQIEKYACVYVAKVKDLMEFSPRSYFRPRQRPLAHEE